MQMIGVDYMLEKGMKETLINKGVITEKDLEGLPEYNPQKTGKTG